MATLMHTLLVLFGIIVILMTALPFSAKGYWWIRLWDFPRQLIGLSAAATAVAYHYLYSQDRLIDRIFLTTLAVSAVYQLYRIWPYTRLHRRMSLRQRKHDPQRSLKLMACNVLMTNRRVDKFLKVLRRADPDIVAVLEPDHWWEEQLRGIERDYPHSCKCALENTYGMLVYSRLPLVSKEVLFRVEADIPSMLFEVELRSGDVIVLHCIHPKPPLPFSDTFERDAELVLVGKEVKERGDPSIVMGDLNDVAWSYTTRLFMRLSGMLDPRIGRGMYNTFHANIPFLRWPLDHLFHTNHFTLVGLRRLGHCGSDHFPIMAELYYQPRAPIHQPAPVATEEDVQVAEEFVEQARDRQGEPELGPQPA